MADDPGTESGGYLPPEPAGRAPDLGRKEPPHEGAAPTEAPHAWQAGQQGAPQPGQAAWQPPAAAQGWQAPQQGWQTPAPGWQAPPPGWQPPPTGAQPPAGWQQHQPQWGWQPQSATPGNGQAVAGFVLSLSAIGLLVLSFGLSSIVSVGCAGFGISYSLAGRRRVDRGETPQHRGLAQAGFIIGIAALVLALLATVGWILVIAASE